MNDISDNLRQPRKQFHTIGKVRLRRCLKKDAPITNPENLWNEGQILKLWFRNFCYTVCLGTPSYAKIVSRTRSMLGGDEREMMIRCGIRGLVEQSYRRCN